MKYSEIIQFDPIEGKDVATVRIAME